MDTPALEILRTQREDLARRVASIDDAISQLEQRATARVRTAAPAEARQARGKARSSNRSRSASRARQAQPAAQSEQQAATEAPANATLKDAVMATLATAREGMTAKEIAAALTAQGRTTSVNTVLSTLSRLRGQRQAEKRDGGRWFAAG